MLHLTTLSTLFLSCHRLEGWSVWVTSSNLSLSVYVSLSVRVSVFYLMSHLTLTSPCVSVSSVGLLLVDSGCSCILYGLVHHLVFSVYQWTLLSLVFS